MRTRFVLHLGFMLDKAWFASITDLQSAIIHCLLKVFPDHKPETIHRLYFLFKQETNPKNKEPLSTANFNFSGDLLMLLLNPEFDAKIDMFKKEFNKFRPEDLNVKDLLIKELEDKHFPDIIPPLTFKYKNWKGETQVRSVQPIKIWYGENEFHKGKQYFLQAYDLNKDSAIRNFAFHDIISTIDLQ